MSSEQCLPALGVLGLAWFGLGWVSHYPLHDDNDAFSYPLVCFVSRFVYWAIAVVVRKGHWRDGQTLDNVGSKQHNACPVHIYIVSNC